MTNLKHNNEGQSSSEDMPVLEGEFIGFGTPRRTSVVSVPKIHKNRVKIPNILYLPKLQNDNFSVPINMLNGGDGMVKAKRKDSYNF